jgi:hypothetical protein
MSRPALEVADIVRRYGEAYLARYGAVTSTAQYRVVSLQPAANSHHLKTRYNTLISAFV